MAPRLVEVAVLCGLYATMSSMTFAFDSDEPRARTRRFPDGDRIELMERLTSR